MFWTSLYAKFFVSSPIGEGYFKQSNTYLHIIATKIIQMTIDIYCTLLSTHRVDVALV